MAHCTTSSFSCVSRIQTFQLTLVHHEELKPSSTMQSHSHKPPEVGDQRFNTGLSFNSCVTYNDKLHGHPEYVERRRPVRQVGSLTPSLTQTNGVRQELKFQIALWRKSGLFPIQWQYRFRTLANEFFPSFFVFSVHVLFSSDD